MTHPPGAPAPTAPPSAPGFPGVPPPSRPRFPRWLGATGGVLVLAVAGTLVATTLRGGDAPATRTPAPVIAPNPIAPANGTDALAAGIARLQSQLATAPDPRQYAQLGAAYVQQVRATSDPSGYPKAEQALRESLRLQPTDNADAEIGLGALAAGRHDFTEALQHAQAAIAINAYSSSAYGVKVDALTELGRYDEARAAAQKMIDLRPDLSSLSRGSYQLELHGDLAGAHAAFDRALADAISPGDIAFVRYYQGELWWNAGKIDKAAEQYSAARTADPASVLALQGLAKVAWARGNSEEAVKDYAEVVTRLPQPQYLIEYVDLLQSLGRTADAAQQATLLDAEEQLFRANGVNVDLEVSLYQADHGQAQAALAAAGAEYGRRRALVVADAYAWALHAVGKDADALVKAQEATRLGYQSALLYFHRGMIEKALGMKAAARASLTKALAVNPHFSPLQGPQARSALAELG